MKAYLFPSDFEAISARNRLSIAYFGLKGKILLRLCEIDYPKIVCCLNSKLIDY